MPVLPLRTDRLLLRHCRPGDLEATLAYHGDPRVARYLPWEPWTRESAVEQMERRVLRVDIVDPGDALGVMIELDGRVVGDVVLWTSDHVGKAEIGWALHPSYGGRGYATEAIRAVVGLAFDHFEMHRLVARIDPRNRASIRMCERLGMQAEGLLRQHWWDTGEWSDLAVYGLLATEWHTSGSR